MWGRTLLRSRSPGIDGKGIRVRSPIFMSSNSGPGSAPRRGRFGLVAAFLLVVAGLLAVDAVVWVGVRPRLRVLQAIGRDHARSVEVAARIRSSVSSIRREVVRGVTAARLEVRVLLDVRRALDELDAQATALDPVASARSGGNDVATLRSALARCASTVEGIARSLSSGNRAAARDGLARVADLTAEVSDAADAILSLNAKEVERSSLAVERALRTTLVATSLLTALGALAALFLLRHGLRGLARQDALWQAHAAEVDAFAARAAHELRTPLQTVALSLATLEISPGGVRALERARASTRRLSETIDGLLEFSRSGIPRERSKTSSVSSAVDDVRDELAALVEGATVSVDFDVPAGLQVAVAPDHLRTILRNLVGNAVKYGRGRPEARVSVRATAETSCVELEVADNGPGIPPEAVPRIFEPFFRATRDVGGHGLGLATVQRLVEAHDGRITLRSEIGRGTTVRVALPRAGLATPASPGSARAM